MIDGSCCSHTTYAYTDRNDFSQNTLRCLCGGDNLVLPAGCTELCVNLAGSGFMSITQIVGLTQFMKHASKQNISCYLKRPSQKIEKYLKRMNLYNLIGVPSFEEFNRHDPRGNFVPMISLSDDGNCGLASDLMRDVIINHLACKRWGGGTILDMSLGEIIDNVRVHAQSQSDGIVAVQYYPSKSIVEICVADSGRGIVASMSDNPDYSAYNSEQMMFCSLEEGYGQYSGRKAFSGDETSAGMGLKFPTRLTQALGGKMWIVSHKHAIEVSRDDICSLSELYYPGTLISMRLPVEEGREVYADQFFSDALHVPVQWSPEEGWTNQRGEQVDVNRVTGSESGLW